MADTPPTLFISYSRTDSEFVDRLQADLQARGYNAWVDRKRLEGGQDWAETIQRAIERCQVMLIALSPEAITSEWVKREIGYAQEAGKRMLPLMVRHVTQVPIRIQGIQWVDFEASPYERALDALLFALATPVATPEPEPQAVPPPSVPSTDIPLETGEDLVVARQGPPPPDPNLNALYTAGVEARSEGNLELASVYWQQIVERNAEFGSGIVASQLDALMQQLRPLRQQRLREQAQAAMAEGDYRRATGAWRAMLAVSPDDDDIKRGLRATLKARAVQSQRQGDWGEEIGAWEALRAFDPESPEPAERIPIAEQNQQWAWLYVNAQNFARENKLAPAKDALETLWSKAPYFGDPAGIAAIVGATVPPKYEEVQAEQERQRKAQELIELQRKAQEAEQARQRQLVAEREARRQLRPKFISNSLYSSAPIVWLWTLLPLIGAGVTSGMLVLAFVRPASNSTTYTVYGAACAGALVIGLLIYAINYRRALGLVALAGLVILAGAASCGIVWVAQIFFPRQLQPLVSSFIFSRPVLAHLFWLTGGQSEFGAHLVGAALYGVLMGVACGLYVWKFSYGSYDYIFTISAILGVVIAITLGVALSLAVGGGWSLILGILAALIWVVGLGVALVSLFTVSTEDWDWSPRVSAIMLLAILAGITTLVVVLWGAAWLGVPPSVLWVLIPGLFAGAGIGAAINMLLFV